MWTELFFQYYTLRWTAEKNFCVIYHHFLPRDATQSAVMPQYVVCLSVGPSVSDVQVPWSHREHPLDGLERPKRLLWKKSYYGDYQKKTERRWTCTITAEMQGNDSSF